MSSEESRLVERLDRDGFIVLAGLLDAPRVRAMRARIDELLARDREDPTKKHGGTLHLEGLEVDGAFDAAWRSPRVEAVVAHLIGAEFRVAAGYRGPKPGYGAQALHTDDVAIAVGEPYRTATAIVALVEFTERNGATRIVPGSHRAPLRDASKEPGRRHPHERVIAVATGDAILINGHVWHSGTRNESDQRRDALQIAFRRV